ncbi:MAG TPA: fucose isomerase, partial [Candidatus Aerophobetes bacterium]|nr:fucose isomerase [Candidatus Aerophobetes bacterium]
MSLTFGLIVGNRGFFPDKLAISGREEVIKAIQEEGFSVVCPSPDVTRYGV